MKVKEESEKVGFKLSIQKTKIMATDLITSWQKMGKQWKQWETIFGVSQITSDGDCSHEIKRHLLLGRKIMTIIDSILKSRDITFPKNVHLIKGMVFPVVMYGCESWAIKKAQCQRIGAFELWGRRLLRVPWTAKRSNQPILKEICKVKELEKAKFRKRMRLALYKNRSPLIRREGEAVRLVSCCTYPRKE